MADTDSPLKQLVSAFITDFAAWLLQAEVRDAYPLNIELPAATLAADQVFQVTLADGRRLVLHIEFQGRTSHEPMEWRMLEYIARLARTHHLDLWSVVIYVGRGAGTGDTGSYQVNGLDGIPTLVWRYRVIRCGRCAPKSCWRWDGQRCWLLLGKRRLRRQRWCCQTSWLACRASPTPRGAADSWQP